MAELIAEKYKVGIDYVDWPTVALKNESEDTVFDDAKLKKACSIKYNMTFEKWCTNGFL